MNNEMNKAVQLTPFAADLEQVLGEIQMLLIDKNNKYGDAALSPLQVFSKLDPTEAIKIRMDDKLARIKNNQDGDTEDPLFDLLGYLLLYRIASLRKSREEAKAKNYKASPEWEGAIPVMEEAVMANEGRLDDQAMMDQSGNPVLNVFFRALGMDAGEKANAKLYAPGTFYGLEGYIR